MKGGNEPLFWIHTLGIKVNIGWFYGLFILFVLFNEEGERRRTAGCISIYTYNAQTLNPKP